MANYTPSGTTEWVGRNLREAEGVANVEVVSDQVLRVSRDKYDPFMAGIVSAPRVEAETIAALVAHDPAVEIIINVPKESFWTGDAISLAHRSKIATGSYGDLLRVITVEDIRQFRPKEVLFVERGLSQHTRVTDIERVHERLYRIKRAGLPDITAAMLNEYELTADHVRTAIDRYGTFSVAVITNPNGTSTKSANEAARHVGVEILNWGPFLGRLHKE